MSKLKVTKKEQKIIEQIRVMRREYSEESITNFAEILNWKKVIIFSIYPAEKKLSVG